MVQPNEKVSGGRQPPLTNKCQLGETAASHPLRRSCSAALLLAGLLRLARDNFERAGNSLVRADESTQKPQDVNDDGYDADAIDHDK